MDYVVRARVRIRRLIAGKELDLFFFFFIHLRANPMGFRFLLL